METQYSVQRIIKDIRNDDINVQVVGHVKEIVENEHFFLVDKTGKIKVITTDLTYDFKENDLINVLGNLNINIDGEKVIHAQIIQDMNKLNYTYYQKLYELKKELE